jgi:hypothetical protein
MPNFETYQSETLAPGWLRDRWGAAFLGALGARKDAHVALLKLAVKARMPGLAPLDALAHIARERGIDRGPGESEGSFRERVAGAWDTWRWAGTAFGLLLELWHAGYRPASGKVVLQTQGDAVAGGKQYELRADFDPAVHAPEESLVIADRGTGSLGGAPAPLWPDIAVIFVDPLLPAWVPTPPADESDEVRHIRRLILKQKPGHCRCVKLQVSGGNLWGYPEDDRFNGYAGQSWAQAGAGPSATWTPPAG